MTKTIAITGANRGIGRALTELCLAKGFKVWAISRSVQNLEELKVKYPDTLSVTKFDLSQTEEISKLCEQFSFEYLDFLINNAGLLVKKPFSNVTVRDLEDSFRVNFYAPYFLTQTLLPKLKPGSHVVNISTMGAFQGSAKFPELTPYGSSKAALTNLTEVLAQELGDTGPTVNCLAIGAVQTDMLQEAFPGYEAGTSPKQMAQFIYNFITESVHFFNGKVLPISNSTP